jgi:hypothetical protein
MDLDPTDPVPQHRINFDFLVIILHM